MIDDRADGGGDEGRLDQVFAHGEQTLGDGLVADGVGQDGGDIGRPLVQEASDEKKLVCCGVRLDAPSTKTLGPPIAKKMAGMTTTTAPSMAQT